MNRTHQPPDYGAQRVSRALEWLRQGVPGMALNELRERKQPTAFHGRSYPFPPIVPPLVQFRSELDDLDATVRQAIHFLETGRADDARSALAAIVEPAPRVSEAS